MIDSEGIDPFDGMIAGNGLASILAAIEEIVGLERMITINGMVADEGVIGTQ